MHVLWCARSTWPLERCQLFLLVTMPKSVSLATTLSSTTAPRAGWSPSTASSWSVLEKSSSRMNSRDRTHGILARPQFPSHATCPRKIKTVPKVVGLQKEESRTTKLKLSLTEEGEEGESKLVASNKFLQSTY